MCAKGVGVIHSFIYLFELPMLMHVYKIIPSIRLNKIRTNNKIESRVQKGNPLGKKPIG
jgi:Cu/Ag efflux protein CusF